MIIKFKEVYRNSSTATSPADRMTYRTREIVINPEHIVCIRPNSDMSNRLSEGLVNDVSPNTSFCTISLNRGQAGSDIVVVGTLDELNKRIKERKLLHG